MTKILVVKITNAYFVCLVVGLILFLGTTNLVFYDSFIICDIESLTFQTGTEKNFLNIFFTQILLELHYGYLQLDFYLNISSRHCI